MPKVSVIMSVYNGEKCLKRCIDSILDQTFKDFNFYITDDGSTDDSLKILKEYEKKDKRIKIIENKFNLGLTKSLNNLLELQNSEYIARMDADDMSLPARLEKQVTFMDQHPEIGVCAVVGMQMDTGKVLHKEFINHEAIKAALLFCNQIPHSSSMIRGKLINDQKIKYNENFKIIQDYELWSRLIFITEFAILNEVEFIVGSSPNSVTLKSSQKNNYRKKFLQKIFKSTLDEFGITYNEMNIETHYFIGSNKINFEKKILDDAEEWLLKIKNHNCIRNLYAHKDLERVCSAFWYKVCTRSTSLGITIFFRFIKSELFDYKSFEFLSSIKFIIKCLIKYRASTDNRYI